MQGKKLYNVKSCDNRNGGGAKLLGTFDNERAARISLGHNRKQHPEAIILCEWWSWDSINAETGEILGAVRHSERVA